MNASHGSNITGEQAAHDTHSTPPHWSKVKGHPCRSQASSHRAFPPANPCAAPLSPPRRVHQVRQSDTPSEGSAKRLKSVGAKAPTTYPTNHPTTQTVQTIHTTRHRPNHTTRHRPNHTMQHQATPGPLHTTSHTTSHTTHTSRHSQIIKTLRVAWKAVHTSQSSTTHRPSQHKWKHTSQTSSGSPFQLR